MADILLKKQKLTESLVDHLTALNDDCISVILDRLDLRSLCTISKTCNKLREQAAKKFQRKYPNAYITLTERKKQVCVEAITPHIQCFSRIIRNLHITSSKKENQLISLHLQSNYKHRVLNGIKFSGVFSCSFGDQIANTLRTVENVDISEAHRGYESILNHCQSVKRLMFNWSQLKSNKYPSLEYLKIDFGGRDIKSMMDEVKKLFQLNPVIKHFECTTHATYITELVNLLVEFCKNLEIVSLNAQIHHYFSVTKLLYEPLKKLDEQKSVKEIRLTTDRASNVNALASHSLKKLTRLTLNFYFFFGMSRFFNQQDFGEVDLFTNVQFLFLRCVQIKFNATDMAKKMPNLKEFHLKNNQRDFDAFKEVIMPLVSFSPKLQKIVAFDDSMLDITPVEPLEDKRSKLSPASNLIIYITDDIYIIHNQFIETFNQKFSTVNIRAAKFSVAAPLFSNDTNFGIYYE